MEAFIQGAGFSGFVIPEKNPLGVYNYSTGHCFH
jgi:hypothetical protein